MAGVNLSPDREQSKHHKEDGGRVEDSIEDDGEGHAGCGNVNAGPPDTA